MELSGLVLWELCSRRVMWRVACGVRRAANGVRCAVCGSRRASGDGRLLGLLIQLDKSGTLGFRNLTLSREDDSKLSLTLTSLCFKGSFYLKFRCEVSVQEVKVT